MMKTIGWGLFCACSWTWCIGMFLPVIMLSRHGWVGYFIFAVPNVIGCAAFGYVLRNRERSIAFLERHGVAATWFSIVTIAFHMFFWVFLVTELRTQFPSPIPWFADASPLMLAPLLLAGIAVLGWIGSMIPERIWPAAAAITWLTSMILFVVVLNRPADFSAFEFSKPMWQAPWLLPTIAFGFLLCPYLDLTFHRALQESPSRHAFGVFGVSFACMIAMTCFVWFAADRSATLTYAALAHIALQTVFTVAVHMRAIRHSPAPAFHCSKRQTAAIALTVATGLLWLFGRDLLPQALQSGADNYTRFLVFYGLVFPLYVWVYACFPSTDAKSDRTRFAIILIACLPIYELGYLQDRPYFFGLALAMFALAIMVRPKPSTESEAVTPA